LSSRARATAAQAAAARAGAELGEANKGGGVARTELIGLITELTAQMHSAAAELQFEVAARIRDEIKELKRELRGMQAAGV
jgi:excinuclease ABC subunit B